MQGRRGAAPNGTSRFHVDNNFIAVGRTRKIALRPNRPQPPKTAAIKWHTRVVRSWVNQAIGRDKYAISQIAPK